MIKTLSYNLIVLLLFVTNTRCQSGNVEIIVDDQKLLYVNQNLTWNEASSLCRSFGSSLVTISTSSFASHVLEALAAFKAQELLWVGGRLIHDRWMWKLSGLPIQIDGQNFHSDPSDETNLNLASYRCLAINTTNFVIPAFVSLDCSAPNGLLCETAQQQPTLLVEEFGYNNHNYSIYEGQSTWQSAVALCNKHNKYLTAFSDVTELQEVALTLASYTHLDISIVWVGALKDHKSWQWVTTGDYVQHNIENDTKLFKCLALNIKTQVFFAENCSNGRPFVCESRHSSDDDFWESFVYQSTEYTVHSQKISWEKANKMCESDNSYLAVVEDLPTVNAIAVNMGNSWESLPTVWLGAKAVQGQSGLVHQWQNSQKQLSLSPNKTGYPPWKNTSLPVTKNVCLVLESSENAAHFSNTFCNDAHGFVCQRDSSEPLPITFNFRIGDKDLLFHDKPETWNKAQEVCKLAYSRLLIVSDPEDLLPIKRITTRHRLWLDGTYRDNKWQWKRETSELPVETGIYGLSSINNVTRTCLAIYLQTKLRPKFVASACQIKLPYVCERNSQKEQLIKYKGSEYTVINKHLTWYEASAICQARDQNLAVTCDINEAEFLAQLTTSYGDLWLGAIKREAEWVWDAINISLPHKTNAKIGYPPWLNLRASREGLSCLMLALNPNSHVAFIDTSCNEVKSFICEKNAAQNHKPRLLQPRMSVLDDRQYIFYPQLSTWRDASEECFDNLAFLAVISTVYVARHVANLTYGHPEVWIGGAMDGNKWKWAINGEDIKSWGENETQWTSENEVSEDFAMKPQFLALNRLNPNIPLFIEKGGFEKLGFVCERANNPEKDEYFLERIPFDKGELLFVEDKLNYTDAYSVCEANNGVLVTADDTQLLELIAKHSRKYHGVWVGSTLTTQSQKFLWTHIRSEVVEAMELITDEMLKFRVKRGDFRDDVLDQADFEDEIRDVYDSDEDDVDCSDDDDGEGGEEGADNDSVKLKETTTCNMVRGFDLNNLKRLPRNAPGLRRKMASTSKMNLRDYDGESKSRRFTTIPQITNPTTPKFTTVKLQTVKQTHLDFSASESQMNKTQKLTTANNLHTSMPDLEPDVPGAAETAETETTVFDYSTPSTIIDFEISKVTTASSAVEEVQNILLQNLIYCLKIDERGKLVALNCSSRQSFVCEIRSSKTQLVTVQEFSSGNVTYAISNERLSWKKAYRKCIETFGGYLAIFDDIDEIHFVNNISKDFQDLWIGAKYFSTWKWPYIYQNLPKNDSLWSTSDRLYECANVYRRHSSELLLVDRICTEKHGFICKDVKPEVPNFELTDNYMIYWKPANFFDAVSVCSQDDTILASAEDSEQVLDIIGLRKGLHSFWVSGLHFKTDWLWLGSGRKLINNPQYVPGRECMSVFKRNSTSYSLIDRDCATLLPFVCQNVNNRSIVFNDKAYTFHLTKTSWSQANEQCLAEGQQLAIVEDRSSASQIQTVALLFGDVWIDGKWSPVSKWVWDFTREIIYKDPLLGAKLHKPKQRIVDPSSDACLFVHSFVKQPGLLSFTSCSAPKGFICQGVSTSEVPSIESLQINGRMYTIYSSLATWIEANDICRLDGSYLTITDTAEELAVLDSFRLNTFWVGGSLQENESWSWNHTGKKVKDEILPAFTDRLQGESSNCLTFYRHGKQAEFVDVDCDMKLPFVCEEVGHGNKPQTRRIDFENEYLILHSLQLTWSEAKDMCVSAGQHLASITDDNIDHFLNLPSEYHDLWLDGRNEDDIWMWTELDTEIQATYDGVINNSFIRTSMRPDHNCLNLYRPVLNTISFVDRRCTHRFGFICQGTKLMHDQIKTVVLGQREYSIYAGKVSWHQARKICKANGTYLAVLNSTDEIELLTRSHISFAKLWTGAVHKGNAWVWDHTGSPIRINMYTRFLNESDQCGMIKRSNKGSVALLPKNCTSAYAFICEERGDQGKWTSKVFNISGHYYSVHSERTIWSHASDMCAENGQYLALIDTDTEMEVISQLDMDFHDLWIGARRAENSSSWTWLHTGQEFSFEESPSGYPQLIKSDKSDGSHCLNIYREWNSEALFISRDCKEQHGYICESVAISKQNPQVQRTMFNGRRYVLIQHQLTWAQAYRACDRFNGYLSIVSSQEEADFLVDVSGAFHDLWIGGKKIDSVWSWHYTGQQIDSHVTWQRTPTRDDHDCLNLYSADSLKGRFMDRRCTERHSFVCEETHQFEYLTESDYLNLENENLEAGSFLFPTNFLPHFATFRNRMYMFSNDRVDFDTAIDICRQNTGYLLIFENEDEMKFIANNTNGYHNLWIDGEYDEGRWIWDHLGTTVPAGKFAKDFKRVGHDCLLFYRHDNVSSYYIDRKCEEKHSFVCKDVIQESEREIQVESTYKTRYYLVLPNTKSNWYEAKEYCRTLGSYLAIPDDTNEAEFLASLGNDLWIDGKFEDATNAWNWRHIGQEILFEDYNLSKYAPTSEDSDTSKCLNLFRRFNDTPNFVERSCKDKFGFVCENLISIVEGTENITSEFNGRRYLFVGTMVAWEEAYATCRENGSYLAIVSNQEEGKFIAERANNFHDVWIDGQFSANSWISNFTGQTIEAKQTTTEDNVTATENLVKWISSEKRAGHTCLNSYMPSLDVLFFVARYCFERHSFVCEEVIEKFTPDHTTINYGGVRYTVSAELVTWDEANERCRKHGYLAIIDTMDEAAALAKYSGRYHSLWLGAKFHREDWFWNYSGEIVDQDVSLWANIVPRRDSKCALLYRDNSLKPFIVDQMCEEKFGYVCEEGETWDGKPTLEVVKHDGKIFTFYRNRLSWDDAKRHCENERSTLAVVTTVELADLLIQQKEYYDFWIDGLSEGLLWTWSSTGIYLKRFEDSDVKYVRIIPRHDRSCLALFRSNSTVRYLDDSCNVTKPFLCQKYDSVLNGNVTLAKTNFTRYYLVNNVKKTWFDAWETCAANGSYLPIIKDAATADFVSSLYPYNNGEIWIGARKFSSWWTWELTEEAIMEAESEGNFPVWARLNQPDNMCLGLDHQTSMYAVFTDLNCSLSRNFVCEQGCLTLPPVNGSWSRKECMLRVQKFGEECTVDCDDGYLSMGVPNIICMVDGWSDYVPNCLNVRDYALNIVSNTKDALNSLDREKVASQNVGLLFMIDTSSSVGWENYLTMLEIIKSISVGVGASNNKFLQGVISFEAEAKVEVDLREIDTCTFIQSIDKLAYKPNSDVVSFKKAFETASKVLQNANASGSAVLLVITSNNSTEDLDDDLLRIKENNTVIVMGIKPQVNVQLVQQLASGGSSKYQLNIDYSALDEIAYFLNRTFLYSGQLGCCMRLRNSNGFNINPTSCSRDVSEKNARCSIHCDSQHHLQGMESLMCTSNGWQSTLELRRPFPECYTIPQITRSFLNNLKSLHEKNVVDSTLFLVDQSGSMLEDDFVTEIRLVKQQIRLGNKKSGVIVFSSEAYVEVPLDNYNDSSSLCALYDHLDSLRFSGGSTDYEKAFFTAIKEIDSYVKKLSCPHQRTLIVMLTDGQNSEAIQSAEKLKLQGHKIAVISVGVNKRRNLVNMVSNSEDNLPLLFSVNTFDDLDALVLYVDSYELTNTTVICCKIPAEFQKAQSKLFIVPNEDLELTCPPGYSLSVENSTLKCTEVGLNIAPTCFAVPKRIAGYVNAQFYHIFSMFNHHSKSKDEKQLVVFLIDQTESMTSVASNQALMFVKNIAGSLQLSKNRMVGLINGQKHEAVMLIEPNVSCPKEFARLLTNVTFGPSSFSLYKSLKYILEKLVGPDRNVLTVIISNRDYVSTPSLKLASKILMLNNNIYVMEVHNETIDSNIGELVQIRNDLFISGYYMMKNNLYYVDSFETLEAVAENLN